ncbi:Angio-associated migratory cell protein [Spatholobus suberectus]|nr:Angio-associated migratory cell protein [Spatholobus suberectus]
MNFPGAPPFYDDEDDDGEVFIDESEIMYEVSSDNEVLPDAYDDSEPEHGDEMPYDVKEPIRTLGIWSVRAMHIIIFGSNVLLNISEASDDGSVRVFGDAELFSVACSPIDATLVAAGGNDGTGFLWKIGQEDWARELQGHTDSVSSLAFSYDGEFLASGSLDGTVQIWDVFGNLKGTLEGPGPAGGIEWLGWHPREHKLVAGCWDSSVWLWDAATFAHLNTFLGHGGCVMCGGFTPDGKLICTGSDDATLRIWNAEGGGGTRVVRRQPGHPYHTDGLKCLAISSTSTLALTGSRDGSTYLVNITTGRVIGTLASRSKSIECVGFAPSYSWAAVGGMDQKLIIWDIEHSLSRDTFDHEDGVTCLAWLGAWYMATGCQDGNVRLWDSRSGECVKYYTEHSAAIQSLSVSADQNFILSASDDGKVIAYDMRM